MAPEIIEESRQMVRKTVSLTRDFLRDLHWGAVRTGLIAVAGLGALIVIGSRRLLDFDSALVGYTFACLFATFGIVYRYSVWLTKPPTRKYWRRSVQIFTSPSMWRTLRTPRMLPGAVWSKILAQDFVWRRGIGRWIAHMLICWGCVLAAAVTFPLVFGWIHFEQGAIGPNSTYRVIFFGFQVQELPLKGVLSWFVFHALVVSAFMVTPGVMIAMYRRMAEGGALAVQRFGRDFLPLILLFAISVSGLLLWVSYEWMDGYYYSVLAQFHAATVIGTLLYLPFGKLFHIFQRPASLGVAMYRHANETLEQAKCPVTGEAFAPKMQTDDLNEVLQELDFDYKATDGKSRAWNEISPRGRRMLIGRAHSAARNNRFS